MNLKQAKITLEKINSLFNSMSMEEGSVSSIERDLMLSYIKNLYETFLQTQTVSASNNSVITPAEEEKPKVNRTYKPPRIIEIPDSLQNISHPDQKIKYQQAEPQPVSRPQRQSAPEPEPVKPQHQQAEPTAQATNNTNSGNNTELRPLFEFKEAKELSEKLSARPINDLTKALAINDRLLYMNELFSKDLNTLNDALGQLNRYNDMDEARSFLEEMALKYNWLDESRQTVAKDFIQLVRRRYI